MSLIKYEAYDDDGDLSEGLCVYIESDNIDNQKLLDEILKSEWKYIVDMNVYFNKNSYSIIGYAKKYFTDDQYFILHEYMIKGIGEIMGWLL